MGSGYPLFPMGGAILPPLSFSPLNDAGWIKLGGGLVLP